MDCGGILQDADADTDISDSNIRCRLVITLIFILLALETGGHIIPGPMLRIIDGIVCDRYWRVHGPEQIPPDGPMPERLCNLTAVQTEVAQVKGYSDMLEGLLSTLCATPYGYIADRYGRRLSIRLTIPGFVLNGLITNCVLWFNNIFPVRGIWLASCSWIIGGGPTVAMAVIWTMLADLTTDSNRAVLFFRVGLASQAVAFVPSAGSSIFTTVDPWIPLLVGCGIILIGLAAAWGLPDTISMDKGHESSTDDNQVENDNESTISACSAKGALLCEKFSSLVNPYLFIFTTARLLSFLFSLTLYRVALGSSLFLTQYISTRFNLLLATAQFISSLHSLATIPVFAFLLPYLTNRTLALLPPSKRDLCMARYSILCLSLGCIGIGLSPVPSLVVLSLCIHALGAEFPLAARSLVTALSVGSVVGSAVATNVFRAGLGLDKGKGGGGTGLVYVLSGVVFGVVGGILCFVEV
ncbi:major facilitator superfamily domain-containing protein [Aspergillus karnatakaensis]|uniref:MFS transporter n=1 Tax=Aspergillus karnatakaensis TaxID=1810916 RepID=UPI003CCCE8A0